MLPDLPARRYRPTWQPPGSALHRPEMPGDRPEPEGGYKDVLGRMKKQAAARFRVYGFDAEGRNLGEVTAEQATIRWTVALANRKAAWRPFDGTTHVEHILEHDRPQASSAQTLRNASNEGDARARFAIVPEPCTPVGRDRPWNATTADRSWSGSRRARAPARRGSA